MKDKWVPVTIDLEHECSECGVILPIGTRTLYSSKNQLFSCLTHPVIVPKGLKPFSRMSEEEKFLKHLGSISKRYGAKIIETRLFNRLDPSLRATYLAVASNGVSLVYVSNDEGLVQIQFGSSGLPHSYSFHLIIGEKERNDLIEEIRLTVKSIKVLLEFNDLDIPVKGILSLPQAEWPLFNRETKIGGILLEGANLEDVFFAQEAELTIDEINKAFNILKENLGTKKI